MILSNCDRDPEGYLVDPDVWSREIAIELAQEEKLELTDACWPILEFVRAFWEENRVIPDIRHVDSHIAEYMGITNKQAKQHLFELFPYGYVKQTCKIAGMRRPRAWSTG